MISERQLQEWRRQSLTDMEQYRKDEQDLKELHEGSKPQGRTFFEKLRAKYFNFQSQENDKLSRLLVYTYRQPSLSEMEKQIQHYPQVLKTYLTYNTCSIIVFAACVLAPKKIFSKLIISLVAYGFKKNITDGMFTYYMLENMALSPRMDQKQQQLRNVLQFYYMHRFFTKTLVNEQQKKQASDLLAKIQTLNETYKKFKQVQKLI